MRIRSIETFRVCLPFHFSFAHNLASRAESKNLIVKVTLEDGTTGYGEGIPRDYVTGEGLISAEDNVLSRYSPPLSRLDFSKPEAIVTSLEDTFRSLGLGEQPGGSAWCALELAILDAASKSNKLFINNWLGVKKGSRIRYGGVVPFSKRKAFAAVLWFYKLYGFKTVKLKVGQNLEEEIEKLRLTRKIMGNDCTIRVDANCAWNLEQALRAAECFKKFRVASYEQPCPAKDWQSLQTLSSSIEEDVIVDESLCTLKEAKELAKERICNGFNIRISKVGGMLPAKRMIDIAQASGLRIHLGAQVGESGILSSAQRIFASMHNPCDNYEGSANAFLLKKDLCRENLTVGPGGWGDFSYCQGRFGLGLNILEDRLMTLSESPKAGTCPLSTQSPKADTSLEEKKQTSEASR